MKYLFNCFILIILSLFFCLNLVSALGVSIPYSLEDPLKVYPGQEKEVLISLQNFANQNDLIIYAEVMEGGNIAEIMDLSQEYNVIANQPIGARVSLNIKIPENENIGKEYIIRLRFQDVTKRGEGMVGINPSIESSFKVLVFDDFENKPKISEQKESLESKNKFWEIFMMILIIGLVIALILAFFLILSFLIKRKKL